MDDFEKKLVVAFGLTVVLMAIGLAGMVALVISSLSG